MQQQDLIELNNELIPLVDLKKILHLDTTCTQDKEIHEYNIIEVEAKGKKVGLIVDETIRNQEIVVKRLGKPLENLKGYSGATILGDGTVILLLDIANLIF